MRASAFALLCIALFCIARLHASAAEISATDAGIAIDAGSMGAFTLDYPQLIDKQEKPVKPIEKRAAPNQALLKYENGAEIAVAIEAPDTVALTLDKLPPEIAKFRMEMRIDFSYADGGKWRIGDAPLTPFPAQKPPKPFLFQGNQSSLQIVNFEGRQLHFTIPPYSFQQLQDNREWNWKIFAWSFIAPINPGVSRYTLTIAETAAAPGARRVTVVDRFGQDAQLDFPGKIETEDELKQDAAREQAEYDAISTPPLDPFGGLPEAGARLGLKATGFFHVEKPDQRWFLVTPAGNPVFHIGICSFGPSEDYTYIKGRENIYEWLPPFDGEYHTAFHPENYWSRDTFSFYIANLIRKYDRPFDREEWTARMISRVRKFGFNATGAFSTPTDAHQTAQFPYVLSLPLSEWELGGQIPGLRGIFDPFDPRILAKMDQLFAKHIAPNAKEPLIIGYFLANEQAFEDIPRVIPSLKAAHPVKIRLAQHLQTKYPDIADFNRAWAMQAPAFHHLRDAGLPIATKQAAQDMQEFTEIFLNQYFQTITETFHKYDANHLLLANRWQPGTANSELLCRTTAKYMDVISLNYYTYAIDKSFLQRLHLWTGDKPMILSEFFWASPADTALPGGKELHSQKERGLAYRNYLEQAATLPWIIGIEWFTLIDQARSGRWFERYNGENANSGLFSVADRPYRQCLDEMAKTNFDIYAVLFAQRPPFAFDDPKFTAAAPAQKTLKIPRAEAPIRLDGSREGWPGTPPERIPPSQIVEGADARGLEASFRLCWDDQNLYLLVEVTDPTPMKNQHTGHSIWSADAVELFLGHENVDQPGPLLFSDRQLLLSAALPDGKPQWHYANAPAQQPCRLVVLPRVDGAGYTLEAAIPFEAFGFKPTPGLPLRFDLAIDNSSDGKTRIAQIVWNGIARNSADRTHWGKAILSK